MREKLDEELMDVDGGEYAITYKVVEDAYFYPNTMFYNKTSTMNYAKSNSGRFMAQKGKKAYANSKLIKIVNINGKILRDMVCCRYNGQWGYISSKSVKKSEKSPKCQDSYEGWDLIN